MQIYTDMVLGETDPGLREPEAPPEISRVPQNAAEIEALGFDAVVATETKDDSFMLVTLAATSTTRLNLATGIAIAFARAPYVTALAAYRLQNLSQGRFTLGLGSQVQAHIVRRFGLERKPLGPWMRDYIGAVRAFWNTWQTGQRLKYESESYKLDLMVPLFDPGKMSFPVPPIHLAVLNPYMCQVAGEVADGLWPHPVCTPRYISEVMLPAAAKGAEKAGRDVTSMPVSMKPLIASARDEAALQSKIRDVRAKLAFYISTPGYRAAVEFWGLNDLAKRLSVLSREQRWDEMSALVDDEVLNTFAVVGTHAEIADKIVERFSGVLTRVGFSIAVENEQDAETMRSIVQRVQRG